MQSKSEDRRLPPPEPGRFGGAVVNSYMYGFWLGMLMSLAWFVKHDLGEDGSRFLLIAFGIESIAWAKFWAFSLYFIANMGVSGAAVEYYQFTNRTYLDDRLGFTRAGGQDIGTLSGLVAIVTSVVLFGTIIPAWISGWFRIPLLLGTAILLGVSLARLVTRRVFTVLFG